MKTRIGARPYRVTTVLGRESKSPSDAFPAGQTPEVPALDSPATNEFESSLASDAAPELEKGGQAPALRAGPGEFAPGIPGERGIYHIPKVRPRAGNEEWTASLSMHPAARRGDHHDLRLIDPKGRAHSWAFQDVPDPGKSTYAVQQPTHKKRYALRTEPFTIPEGYGATRPGAQVEPKFVAPVEVIEAGDDKIRFLKHEGQQTQEFVLRKLTPAMGSVRPMFALHNATKNRSTGEGQKIPSYKPKYQETTPEAIDVNDSNQLMTPKLDGAHVLVDLPGEGDRFARVFSYRPTARDTGLIEHTFKFQDFQKRRGAPEVKNTMIRAEAWASDKDGNAIPAEQLGGLLNAGVLKSRQKQDELGIKLRLTGFDVVRHNGRNMENKPFADKLEVLSKVNKVTRGFVELPEIAGTPEEKTKMLEDIKNRARKDTHEGVVLHSIATAAPPIKAKFKPDVDVYVTGVFNKPRGEAKGHAGGLEYSFAPGGPTVGRVGTGFDHATRKDMFENPEKYVGRVAKVQSVRSSENMTDPSQLTKALRAPSFQGWHLDKTDPKLMDTDIEKKGQENEKAPLPIGAGAATLGGVALLGSPTLRGSLLGYKRVYHGTDPGAVKSIQTGGLDPNYGGTGAAGELFKNTSKGRVHVSGVSPVARMYGRKVIKADIPLELWEKFDVDPNAVLVDPSTIGKTERKALRHLAARSSEGIDPKYIHGSGSARLFSRTLERMQGLPAYVRKHPGRFGVGLVGMGTGAALLAKSVPELSEYVREKTAQNTLQSDGVVDRLRQAWLEVQNRAQPESIIDEAMVMSPKLQKLRPMILGAAQHVPEQNVQTWLRQRAGGEDAEVDS